MFTFQRETTSPNRRRRRLSDKAVAIGLSSGLLVSGMLSGCGVSDGGQAAATTTVSAVSAEAAPDDLALVLDDGQGAPTRDLKLRPLDVPPDRALPAAWDFSAVKLDDGSAMAGAEIGAGPTIVGFVTPWCPVCKNEAPDIADAAAKNPEINYVLIHASGTKAEHLQFVDDGGLVADNIVNLHDADGELWQRFSVVSQPSYVLVDANGLMRSSVGQLEHDGLVRAADMVTAGF